MDNTRNLMDFGIRELRLTARLLSLFKTDNDKTALLGDTISPEFNPESGYVFLIDADFNVAMLNGEELQDWHRCPECGVEGFLDDVERSPSPCCKQYTKQFQSKKCFSG